MFRELTLKVEEDNLNRSIKDFLTLKGYSHNIIVQLKKCQGILVNGTPVHTDYVMKPGDLVTLSLDEHDDGTIIPEDIPLSIIYEDQDILVVNKPSGMPVHPSYENYHGTLANAVMFYYQCQGKSVIYRNNNRLDKDTTGITVIAKNLFSSREMSRMVVDKTIDKEYLAIVQGKTDDSGTVNAPIARKEEGKMEREVNSKFGLPAVTHYQLVHYLPEKGVSLLKLNLETGRTHQIRVHMSYIGHPLIGDTLYNPANHMMDRQALHCSRMTFAHPITGIPMDFCCPLPDDMRGIIET